MVSDLASHAGDSMDFNGIVGWKPRKNASNIGGCLANVPRRNLFEWKDKSNTYGGMVSLKILDGWLDG